MLRMKIVASVAAVLATGLLLAHVVADGPSKTPPPSNERWDDAGQTGELAMLQAQDDERGGPGRGPGGMLPGPPPGKDGDRMGPPGSAPHGMGIMPPGMPQGPETGHGQMPGMPGGPGRMMGGMHGFGMNDPEMLDLLKKDAELDRETHQLAGQYRQAAGERREKIKKDIEEKVSKQFEVRQQRRNLELKRLEEQLQRLRDAVSQREKVRKDLIGKRVSDLLGTDKELDF